MPPAAELVSCADDRLPTVVDRTQLFPEAHRPLSRSFQRSRVGRDPAQVGLAASRSLEVSGVLWAWALCVFWATRSSSERGRAAPLHGPQRTHSRKFFGSRVIWFYVSLSLVFPSPLSPASGKSYFSIPPTLALRQSWQDRMPAYVRWELGAGAALAPQAQRWTW